MLPKPNFGKKAAVTLPLVLLAAVCLGGLSLLYAMKENRLAMLYSYLKHPLIIVMNVLPVIVLLALLYALTGRAFVAFPLTGAIVMGFTWANWFKLQFRNDPLMAEDVLLIKEAGDMAGKYDMFLPAGLVFTVLCIALGTVILCICGRWRPSPRVRLITAAVLVVSLVPLRSLYFNKAVYTTYTENNGTINQWVTTQVYQSKGFVYPFLYSIKAAIPHPPEGYNKDEAAARLAAYPETDIPADKKVNIVAVMLEAFCDFTDVENAPELAYDVYAPYHALEEEGISGKLVTNIFAGGTINSERGFVTGYPTLPSFNQATNSYAWYLRSQGYRATGSHPCYNWFYNRENINAAMGFEDYLFLENHYGELTGGEIGYDDVFFPELMRLCDEETPPYFSFSVTYQGHGPYSAEENRWGGDFIVNDGYTDAEYNILNNYFGSVENTCRNVAALADHFRDSDEPTVLVIFGDHKPWLGDNQSVYNSLGIDIDMNTPEGFLCHYSTQYLIWGNDAAKQALGRELTGEGPTIGPSFLMAYLFDRLGWDAPGFMQTQKALLDEGVTMYHAISELCLQDGELMTMEDLPEKSRSLVEEYLCDAYYERTHFRYRDFK